MLGVEVRKGGVAVLRRQIERRAIAVGQEQDWQVAAGRGRGDPQLKRNSAARRGKRDGAVGDGKCRLGNEDATRFVDEVVHGQGSLLSGGETGATRLCDETEQSSGC